jgi:hypothetical protein
MWRWTTMAAAGLLLAACGSGNGDPAASQLEQLHAVRGPNPGIYDEQNRQVLLRGVNYNVLGDYYQQYPDLATTIPPDDSDMPRMAQIGLNSIRLVLNWSAIETQPGVYDSTEFTWCSTCTRTNGASTSPRHRTRLALRLGCQRTAGTARRSGRPTSAT